MLQVTVHADDSIATAVVDASDHGGLISEITGKIQNSDVHIGVGLFTQNIQGTVSATVIDEDDHLALHSRLAQRLVESF